MRLNACRPLLLLAFVACATSPAPRENGGGAEAKPIDAKKVEAEKIDANEAIPFGQLPADVHPVHYTLAFDLDPRGANFSGVGTIALTLDRPRAVIWMHGKGLHVSEISLGLANGESIAAKWEQVDESGVAKVTLARAAAAGAALLHFVWDAPFDPQLVGIYKTHAAGRDYMFSKFEATYARRAFPSFDEPGFKTPFSISLTVPELDQAISNAPLKNETPLGNGKKRVEFAETKPLPTYLVAMLAGEFDLVSAELPANAIRATPLPLRAIAVKGNGEKLQTALREGALSIDELEKRFGLPFPYPKIDLIAVPDFQSGAMENAGAITFRDQALLLDEKTASLDQRMTVASVTAHELAHQWFGDSVTMKWWDDIWLNEGFATFMAVRVLEARHPEFQEELNEVRATGGVMRADELVSARQIRQPINSTHDITNAFDGITYQKGAAVLGMFERSLGSEKFFAGVRAELRAHANGTATTADLLEALSTAAGTDVRGPFNSFLDRPGVPLIEAKSSCNDKHGAVHLKQSRSLPLGSSGSREQRWQVPVCIRYGLAGKSLEACTLLTESEQDVALQGCPDWIFPNADAAGYYRWSVAPSDLVALRERGLASLSARERISHAQNLVAAFRSGALPADAVLAALVLLVADKSGAVAAQPMGILLLVHDEIAKSGSERKAIEALGKRLYEPLLNGAGGLGWHSQPGESSERRELRESVIQFLAIGMNDAEVLKQAAKLGLKYLAGESAEIDADLVPLLINCASVAGDANLFAANEGRMFASEDSEVRQRLLIALSLSRDPALAASARALAFDPRLRQNERALPYFVQLSNAEYRDAAFRTLTEKFDALAPLLPDRYAGFLLGSIDFCSAEDGARVQAFFGPRAASINGGPRDLATRLEAIHLCATQVEAQGPSARKFLQAESAAH